MRDNKFKFVVRTNDNIQVTESYNLCDLMDFVNVLSEYSADEVLEELQYTGLKDKNGVEIYEGDIVKMLESGVHEKWASIKAVEFDNKYLGFSPFCYLNFIHSNNIVEVIGNIYENKELLK